MQGWRGYALGIAAVVGPALLEMSHAHGAPEGRVVTVSNKSFDDVIQQLKWRLGGYGITIVCTLDYQQILKRIETHSKRSMIFEILRRPWVKTILQHDPAAGLEIPLRVYIYEQADGKTAVSFNRPSKLFDGDDDVFEAFGQGLDETLQTIVEAATR